MHGCGSYFSKEDEEALQKETAQRLALNKLLEQKKIYLESSLPEDEEDFEQETMTSEEKTR